MKNLLYILTIVCCAILISCVGGQADENKGDTSAAEDNGMGGCEMVDPSEPGCDMANCDMIDCEKKCDKKCDKNKNCDKNKGCDKSSCEKYNCDKAEGCTAECMANCENPEQCERINAADSSDMACDGAE